MNRPVQITEECLPKVGTLLNLLLNLDTEDSSFDQEEQEQLSQTPVGDQLSSILRHCQQELSATKKSKALLHKKEVTPQSHAKDVLRFEACALRLACPTQLQLLEHCWAETIPKIRQEEMKQYVCQSQRQAVERCAGLLVSQSVRAATQDPFDNEQDY